MAGCEQLPADLHRGRVAPRADAVPETDAVSHLRHRAAPIPLEVKDTVDVVVYFFSHTIESLPCWGSKGLG